MSYSGKLFSTRPSTPISIFDFINKLTSNRLSSDQLNKAVAYLRDKKIVYYDEWCKCHVALIGELELPQGKQLVLSSIYLVTCCKN